MVCVEKDGFPWEEPVGLRGSTVGQGGEAGRGELWGSQHRSPGQEWQDRTWKWTFGAKAGVPMYFEHGDLWGK